MEEDDPFTVLSAKITALTALAETLLVWRLAEDESPESSVTLMCTDLYLKQPHLRDPSGSRVGGPERLASEMIVGMLDRAPKAARILRIKRGFAGKGGPPQPQAQSETRTPELPDENA